MAGRRSSTAFKTKRLTVCALLSALAVVILGLGAIIEVMDISLTMVASFVMLLIFWCYGRGYAFMSFFVTGVLSLLLMPQSFAPWMFLGLFGYYPMVKNGIDKLPKVLRVIVKLLLVTAVLAVYLIALYLLTLQGSGSLQEVFNKAFGDPGEGAWLGYAVLFLTYLAFICYDVLIDRLLIIYRYKWKSRVEKWMK